MIKRMKNNLVVALAVVVAGILFSSSVYAEGGKIYELRTYTSTPGKLDDLQARFRDHTTRIFNKHGMKVVGYWVPVGERSADTLIYILEHASADSIKASWTAFGKDPEWQKVAKASNANGKILANIENTFMTATDYSPIR